MLIIGIILWGMLLGAAAQWLLRGNSREPRDWGEALVAGLLGSFVGGLLINFINGDGLELAPSGIIGSVVGAVVVLLVWRAIRGKPTKSVG
jgi:uncharacterized membrane protein YeaQ/YmgE (transglycosylase-associated protein family)